MIVRSLTREEVSVTLSQLVVRITTRITTNMKLSTDADEDSFATIWSHRLDRTDANEESDKTFTMMKIIKSNQVRREQGGSWDTDCEVLFQTEDYSCKMSISEQWRLPTYRSYWIDIILSQAACQWKEDLCHSQDESESSCYWYQKTMIILRELHGAFFM